MYDTTNITSIDGLRKKIMISSLPDSEKNRLLGIIDGRLIPPLTGDIMSKHLFSPDTHPDRFDFILQRVMRDPSIKTSHSAANKIPVEFLNGKRTISDISSWLMDERFASIEFQILAQEFSMNRYDLYASRMLLLCYSASENMKKSDIDYTNFPGVMLVVLMRKSPDFLKSLDSKRYIHRFTDAVSDTGISVPLLRKIAFVQLDKALEQFLSKTYNKDEDLELLTELALIADANNSTVKEAIMENAALKDIYDDASIYSLDLDMQLALLKAEFEATSYDHALSMSEKVAIEKGTEKGLKEGLEKGLEEGMAKGLEEGMAKGIEEGMAKGLEEGMAKGLEEGMAKGLEEGMAKGIEEGMAKGLEEGMAKGIEEGMAKGIEEGMAKGIEEGITKGEARNVALTSWLHKSGRDEDIWRSLSDPEYLDQLNTEFEAANTKSIKDV